MNEKKGLGLRISSFFFNLFVAITVSYPSWVLKIVLAAGVFLFSLLVGVVNHNLLFIGIGLGFFLGFIVKEFLVALVYKKSDYKDIRYKDIATYDEYLHPTIEEFERELKGISSKEIDIIEIAYSYKTTGFAVYAEEDTKGIAKHNKKYPYATLKIIEGGTIEQNPKRRYDGLYYTKIRLDETLKKGKSSLNLKYIYTSHVKEKAHPAPSSVRVRPMNDIDLLQFIVRFNPKAGAHPSVLSPAKWIPAKQDGCDKATYVIQTHMQTIAGSRFCVAEYNFGKVQGKAEQYIFHGVTWEWFDAQ